jgi:mannose-6-phosphate isomerase-like protein (cupin superfamily)
MTTTLTAGAFSAPVQTLDASAPPQIVHADAVFRVLPGTTPDYKSQNPLLKLLDIVEEVRLAAERECYLFDQVQYLVPFDHLELYGPSGGNADVLDPTRQDEKTDFQKQNIRNFTTTDALLVRGWATIGDWTGPFLRLSYRGGPDSRLSAVAGHTLGAQIAAWVRVGQQSGFVTLPYNDESDRYEVELWGADEGKLRATLGPRGVAALDSGELACRPELVSGDAAAFAREDLSDRSVFDIAPDHAMHPVRPLHIEVAWCDETRREWDSRNGANYHYEFNMRVRGWNHYISAGVSPNPHGGVGFLEYRNLVSNYGRFAGTGELGRVLQWWNLDAFGERRAETRVEPFMSVDYMDLHILRPFCGIGLHRHRDNQEAFLMLDGQGFMVVGDWCKMPERDRCFEIRTLRAGHLAMLRGGNLHALMNPTDADLSLFMFGGYD